MLDCMKAALEVAGRVCHASAGAYFPVFRREGFVVSVLALSEELRRLVRPVSGYDFSV